VAFFLRRRPKTAAAPRPNSTSIGGSGTFVPELVRVLPLVELEPLVELLLRVELELLVEELVELDVLEVMLPDVELLLLVEVLVETLPEDDDVVVLVMPPVLVVVVLVIPPVLVEVELPPLEVEVDEPPLDVEVEVELPLTLMTVPLLLLELPDEEPLVVVVELIVTLPPLDPPKNPPKNPPPKPPKPLDPPITTGVPPPPAAIIGAGAGSGNGAMANCCASMQTCSPLWVTSCLGASHSSVTMRLICLTLCGTRRCTVLTYLTGFLVLVCLTDFTYLVPAAGASATCTAPPTASAPPAATADSFARAIRTDMVCSLSFDGVRLTDPK
jgi:hypothetical protein